MQEFKFSKSFYDFSEKFKLQESIETVMKKSPIREQMKAMLSFVNKPGSSICIKVANDIAEKIGIIDYVGISYFPDDRMFMISAEYATSGELYPVHYNKSDKKYRCYRRKLFNQLIEAANISFDGCTCISYHKVKFEEHPNLGKIALVYLDEA